MAGMAAIGLWVTANIEMAIVQNRADATALFVDSIVSPLSQTLAHQSALDPPAQKNLLAAVETGPLSERFFSFKIWTPEGDVAFSSDPGLVGQRFALQPEMLAALNGEVVAAFDEMAGAEHLVERDSGQELLEIHSPIRDAGTGRIIGVAEFYRPSADIREALSRARLRSWLVVAGVTIAMLALLFVIVARGSNRIDRQRRRLDDQVEHLSQLLAANTTLRNAVDEAAQRAVTLNERYLRRISADLHDGPAQLLAFAVLRLEAIRKGKGRPDDETLVRRSIDDAIAEIRSLCQDLRLPELEGLSGREVALRAIKAHAFHSGATVESALADVAVETQGAKICLYRFLQETLSNATRHAGASRIKAELSPHDTGIMACVEDDGIGFSSEPDPDRPGLGLAGLRERIISLGGRMEITPASNGMPSGTLVRMFLP
ncbi:signal transduction histidine kinase [Rhizobium sp. PP-CC-3G-465]|nr:signal transduction histidine kinase [Rhizobium sp. PP-WC-1G-195]TCP79117.1 signal transduction histidine kinase [Rhizobium sp. PP-CC-2G-626]TCQ04259.1 signal transduction histidine kinase [Rhizobium sp. PP-F2F-G36]TCQ25745.1 signal transduction histidine kinase [Rhizobium sp. PP-CC-3G-465]